MQGLTVSTRPAICLSLLLACAVPGGRALAEERGVVGCPEFKSAWASAAGTAGPSRKALTYGPPGADRAEPVAGLAEVEATVTCRDGVLGHLEMRSAGEAAPFDRAAATVLMALDRSMNAAAATAAIGALRAGTGGGTQAAVGPWGPYELTLSGPPVRPDHLLVLDLAEN